MKTKYYTLCITVAISFLVAGCSGPKPVKGLWAGEGISFTVSESGDTITRLNVFIPYGDEYLAMEYQKLDIVRRHATTG